MSFELLDDGCCGIAGSFGYEAHKYDVSVAIAEHVPLSKIRQASQATWLIADGFSCREQINHLTDRQAIMLPEIMQAAINRYERADSRQPEPGRDKMR